jgi:hypothetical protein
MDEMHREETSSKKKEIMLTELLPPTIKKDGFTVHIRCDKKPINLNVAYYDGVWDAIAHDVRELTAKTVGLLYIALIPNSNFDIRIPVNGDDLRLTSVINSHVNLYNASIGKTKIFHSSYKWETDKNKKMKILLEEKDQTALFLSGGRDSLLTYGLMKEVGHEVTKIFIQPSAAWWFGPCSVYRALGGEKIREDTSRLYPALKKLGNNVRLEMNALLLWSGLAIPFIVRDNCNYLLYGNEFVTSTPFRYRHRVHYDYSFNQSEEATNIIDQYFDTVFDRVRVGSILRPFNTVTIQRLLCHKYPELFKNQMSCNSAQPDHTTKPVSFKNCSACEKCHRTFLILDAIGIDPEIVNLNRKKITENPFSLLQLMKSEGLCPTTPEELFYVLSLKNDYYPDLKLSPIEDEHHHFDAFNHWKCDVTFLPYSLFYKIYSLAYPYTSVQKDDMGPEDMGWYLIGSYKDMIKNKKTPVYSFEKQKVRRL